MKLKKWVCVLLAVFLLAGLFCMPALAAADDVADAGGDRPGETRLRADQDGGGQRGVSGAGHGAGHRVLCQTGAMAYFEYRKHGQFEWTGPAILFVCLIFVLLAPNYIWGIVGL